MVNLPNFDRLQPDVILGALEKTGFSPNGRFLSLNSYENRVFQIHLDEGPPVVAKFYRNHRWSDDAILEEHQFAAELAAHEIPVVAPLKIDSQSLHTHEGFRFCVYPNRGGRTPELDNYDLLEQIGRFVARIHNIGTQDRFQHRPDISLQSYGIDSANYLLSHNLLPPDLVGPYETVCEQVLAAADERLSSYPTRTFRIHGDLHPSNVLILDDQIFIVDLDDTRTGPAIQDLWMFLSGDSQEQRPQLTKLVEGYCEFRPLDESELMLIEPLRTLRIIHYAAWLAARWQEPTFQKAFPWFNSQKYWEDHILSLKEQLALMQEAPLSFD